MAPFERLKDYSRESITFTNRAAIAFTFVVLLMLVLIGRIYYLQVIEHDRYAAISEQNRVQLQPVAPRRGLIYDRNGVLLADNRPNFSLTLLKEEIGDLDTTLAELGQLVELNARDIERFRKRLQQRRRPYETVPLRFGLSEDEIARVSLNYHRLPGIQVEADLVRYYPHGASLVHALGYVGRINERELTQVDDKNYAATHYIGKLGIEKFYEGVLHGQVGFQKVETNARGRILRVLERQDPVPGVDLQLSLDLRLQQFAETLLVGRRAAMVAIEPESGEILALVSTPSYDPNLFVTGISSKDYNALRDSPDLPLFNRSLRGSYPPASTIKPVIALAGLETGAITAEDRVWDPGFYQITQNGRRYRDWKRWGHGWVNLDDALAESCDVWFYEVGHKMGVDPMSAMLGKFGVGEDTSLDLPEALTNFLPSREWKEGSRRLPWYPGDSINMSIGQGFLVMTPLQMATTTAVIANRGRWVQPRMLQGVLAEPGGEPQPYAPMLNRKEKPADVVLKQPAHWDQVIDGMVSVMHGTKGTARRVGASASYRIAGKTGTAQVVGIAQDAVYDAESLAERHRDHALFVAFAPVEAPKIAVALVVENGGGGSSTAAPIAREVMDAWLTGDFINDLEGKL
ncbi:MAG: penicillin-binding protein 2 [Oceanospirillales bacterium]|uniref:Peptidoglycan D,D-transpeptidase MrdA n=1 Tax=Marinobacterium halophilum TaxID=267374 RepID=A0A2P8ETB5_9GAMM|nr:penicillin-binding protein 2 [Marinobacterium halophilum]MBR9830110.1 penicillin-binding protein 2 [Oceanospirillales bacterium]PSL12719.1 penicillin-binding protein 2 [Marinobacterium halophilum]